MGTAARRFPGVADLKLCAIAMGRLGAGEMSYNSDLDLIFVYHEASENAAGAREVAARVVQKFAELELCAPAEVEDFVDSIFCALQAD